MYVCGFVIILHILFNATIVSCLSCSAAKKLNFFAVCGCTFLVAVKHLSFLPFLAKRDKRFSAMLLLCLLAAGFTHWHANATRHQQ